MPKTPLVIVAFKRAGIAEAAMDGSFQKADCVRKRLRKKADCAVCRAEAGAQLRLRGR